MSGHLGVNKSLDRVLSQFYWPVVIGVVTRYCRLCDTCQRTTSKVHFNKKARIRQLKAGDQVLILLPTDNQKLLLQWKGPFPVLERVGPTDYRMQLPAGVEVFQINMLKHYFKRDGSMQMVLLQRQ